MKYIIAIVGMPGAGKTEAAGFFQNKQIPIIRFGDLTDAKIREKGLPLTPDNERKIREQIREELGMAAYATLAKSKIEAVLENNPVVFLDGLYSWEEYVYLIKEYPQMIVLHIYADPKTRYGRLAARAIRPFTNEEARARDIAEIDKLHKGGPIAIADYLIKNETTVDRLHDELEKFLERFKKVIN